MVYIVTYLALLGFWLRAFLFPQHQCGDEVQITPEFYPAFLKTMRIALGIFAVLCAAGIFASRARGRVR